MYIYILRERERERERELMSLGTADERADERILRITAIGNR